MTFTETDAYADTLATLVSSIMDEAEDSLVDMLRDEEFLNETGIPAEYAHLTPSEQEEAVIADIREEALDTIERMSHFR